MDNSQVGRFVESILPLTESTPLLQYLLVDSPHQVTTDPIRLQLKPDELYSHVSTSRLPFVRAPSPEELTLIRTSEMGFFLTPHHILTPGSGATFSVVEGPERAIIDVRTGQEMTNFSQEDINRRRLAMLVVTNPLQMGDALVGHQRARLETGIDVEVEMKIPEINFVQNIT